MTMPPAFSAPPAHSAPARAAVPSATPTKRSLLCPTLVPATIGVALALGVSADVLLREGPVGAAFPIWMAMTVASLAWLAWRGGIEVSREATVWLATAVFFAMGLAWRDADALQAFDFLATIGSLLLAAAALRATSSVVFAPRLRQTVQEALRAMWTVVAGFPALVFFDAPARTKSDRAALIGRRALRIGVVAGAIVVVFGSLLGSADPIFASFVTIPNFDPSALVRHTIAVLLVAWAVAGWARGALIEKSDLPRYTAPAALQLGTLEITTTFVTLIVLFSGFIVAQLGWLFGGEAFLRARTGLTAASYARQGFFQMVWVVLLVIPILVVTRSSIRAGSALAQRHTRLALPVVALLGAIVVSAALRMRLYVQYYGLSTDRVYPLVFMAWLAFILVWLSVTILRDRAARFGPGVVISGLVTLAGLNVVVPDVVVARVNIARSATAGTSALDVQYLSRLSGEAAEPAVLAILADANAPQRLLPEPQDVARCATINGLLNRWGSISPAYAKRAQLGAWRSWNAGDAHAVRVVSKYEGQLQTAQRELCARAKVVKP